MNRQKIEALYTVIYSRISQRIAEKNKLEHDAEAKIKEQRNKYLEEHVIPALLKSADFGPLKKTMEKMGCVVTVAVDFTHLSDRASFVELTGHPMTVKMAFRGPNNEKHIPQGECSREVTVPPEAQATLKGVKYVRKFELPHDHDLRHQVHLLVAEAQLSDEKLLDKVDELVHRLSTNLGLGA